MSGWLSGLWGRRRRSPDPASFAARTEPLHGRLYQAAQALCRDPVEAEDLAQEALVRAFGAWDRFEPDAPLYPWLLRILRNVHLDTVKSARVRRLTLLAAPPEPEDPRPDAFTRLTTEDLRAKVRAAIDTLPSDQALVITLVDLQGLSYAQVADALDLPVGTVRSRLFRGRDRLRRALTSLEGELPAAGLSP